MLQSQHPRLVTRSPYKGYVVRGWNTSRKWTRRGSGSLDQRPNSDATVGKFVAYNVVAHCGRDRGSAAEIESSGMEIKAHCPFRGPCLG